MYIRLLACSFVCLGILNILFVCGILLLTCFRILELFLPPWPSQGTAGKKEYLKCCNNVANNQRNMDYLDHQLQMAVFDMTIGMINKKVKGEHKPFRYVEIYEEEFLPQFRDYHARYKFFVMEGASRTGKSSWPFWLRNDPSQVFYVNCARCMEPDLRKFNWLKHKIILLDEASPEMVINQKLLMQCPPCLVKLGQSSTNCHSYDVFVSGTQMIICSNTWAKDVENMSKLGDRQWIMENQVYYNTGRGPLFLTDEELHFL